MYRLKVVIGLGNPEEKVKGRQIPSTFGAITVNRVLSKKEQDQLKIGSDDIVDEYLEHETEYFKNLSLGQIFEKVRNKFISSPIYSDADLLVAVGDMDIDVFEEYIPKRTYIKTPDDRVVFYFIEKIKKYMGNRKVKI